AAFVAAAGTPGQDRARHAAARTLHATWNTLVSYQPKRAAPGRLTALRAVNRRMHLLFADAMAAAVRGEAPPAAITEEVRGLQAHVQAAAATDALPPGRGAGRGAARPSRRGQHPARSAGPGLDVAAGGAARRPGGAGVGLEWSACSAPGWDCCWAVPPSCCIRRACGWWPR